MNFNPYPLRKILKDIRRQVWRDSAEQLLKQAELRFNAGFETPRSNALSHDGDNWWQSNQI
jgi:hypothetical protein